MTSTGKIALMNPIYGGYVASKTKHYLLKRLPISTYKGRKRKIDEQKKNSVKTLFFLKRLFMKHSKH